MANETPPVLRFTINSIVALERQLGHPITKIGAQLDDPASVSFDLLRSLFWAGMLEDAPAATLEGAGRAMSAMGITDAGKMITEAFTAAFPSVASPS